MFKGSKAFASFSTDNLDRARNFYGDTLGVELYENKDMGIMELVFDGGNKVMIYPKTDHKPATFTVLNILTDDMEKTVDKLSNKGIKFQQYDFGQGMKTDEKGIMKNPNEGSIAWFLDPAGNIISIIEEK